MKISTNKEGKLLIDDIEKDVKDLTVDFLEDVIEKALISEVTFELENESLPITQFFKKIELETKEGSDLKTRISSIDKDIDRRNGDIKSISEYFTQD